ncbi:carbohydrate ABC transporter permease [Paenibacillus sp. MMS20-IR301]|uniref:carbohydrate ABC transporter permease n=1 Tax=Paenibacillus sp. MMS20-IR301 TaxID=2895946 RepID=UPI0028E653F2|nr:carbohydrate ABC transporter permease [Paenibacillus sp. MMS20-IR301]WNS44117.1 carbohydrate ABC transporter permease [Paenibacillus sp. MMS20-IR301]
MSKETKVFQFTAHCIMTILSVLALIPIVLLAVSSFTDNDYLLKNGYSFFPGKLSTGAYTYLLQEGEAIARAYGISFFVTIAGTVLSIIITTLLSYPLARADLPGRNVFSFFVFFTLLFNGGLVPTYLMYTGVFGIKNSIWALIIPGLLLNAYNVLLVRSYFVTGVPTEILEAARIDGASEFATFRRIALPMAKPIVATIALFVGIAYWNDWNNGYIYLTTRTDLFSIQNLLNRMIQNIQFLTSNSAASNNIQEGLAKIPSATVRMAIAVTGILPIVIVYPFIQSNFVKGITLGGVKG